MQIHVEYCPVSGAKTSEAAEPVFNNKYTLEQDTMYFNPLVKYPEKKGAAS